jgi:hypothetical protein
MPGGAALVDALEDEAPLLLWQWELRDVRPLPKELRCAATALRRRAAAVQARLAAVGVALKLLEGHAGGRVSGKLHRALEGLKRAKVGAVCGREGRGGDVGCA